MKKKQEYHEWKYVQSIHQQFLEINQQHLDRISDCDDLDYLQSFETETFHVINRYRKYMIKQISIRNKAISEIEKQIVKPQSRIQNIKPISSGRNKFELKAHKYRLKRKQYRTRQLENENKEIENFQREIPEKINQFQQQFAIKKKKLLYLSKFLGKYLNSLV